MHRSWTRLAQISKTAAPAKSLEQLTELPTSTGAGLFVEHAKFEPLGTPPTLLQVSLPASSVLNARTTSLVAASGDVSLLTQKFTLSGALERPLLYKQITSTQPSSLLLSNPNGFVNIALEQGQEWTVLNSDDVSAWYGDLEIARSTFSKSLKVTANNTANLILTGSSQVFTVQLSEGESISFAPGSIIAYTGTPVGFHKVKSLEIPSFGAWDTIKSYIKKLQPEASKTAEDAQLETTTPEVKETSVLDTIKTWTLAKFNTTFAPGKLFYEIQGPASIIIKSDLPRLSKSFTKEELADIYKNL